MVCLCRGLCCWHAGQQRMPHQLRSHRSRGRLPDCCGRRWAGLSGQRDRVRLPTWLLLYKFDERQFGCLLQHGHDWRRSVQLEAAVLRCAVPCTPIVGSLCVRTWVLVGSPTEISRLQSTRYGPCGEHDRVRYSTLDSTASPLAAPTVPTGPQSTVSPVGCCKVSRHAALVLFGIGPRQ